MTDVDEIQFTIGPVPAEMAQAWLANSRAIVQAVRHSSTPLHIAAHEDMLDLCELLLDIWSSHAAQHDTFHWSKATERNQLVMLVRQWLEIGELTDDELRALDCTWAPEWTQPFSEALVNGAVDALRQAGPEGEALVARLGASVE